MALSRRNFLKGITATSAGLAMPAILTTSALSYSSSLNALKIPDIMTGAQQEGKRVFDLAIQQGTSHFLPQKKTATLGYNNAYLGPVLRMRDGEQVSFHIKNNLRESVSTHWHGMHVPAHADGGPHQPIAPGKTWSPSFQVKQKSGTFWYHAHLPGKTGRHVYQGLAGMIIVDDDESRSLPLPKEYGVDDIPLIVQDRRFHRNGEFQYISMMPDRMMGMAGNVILVNGTAHPQLTLKRQRTRLRLLNGSNARIYNFGFDDNRSFYQIATDGSLLAKAVRRKRLRLAPGERAEILVDFEPNSQANLMTYPDRSAGSSMGMMRMMSRNNETMQIISLRAGSLGASDMTLPKHLIEVPNWSPSNADKIRRFDLQGGMMGMMGGMGRGSGMMGGGGMMSNMWRINGKAMKLSRIDERVALNSIEIWEISNSSMMVHPFHIHDIQFRIIDRNGRPALAHEQGLKDTVLVNTGETVRVIAEFKDYANSKIPYMYHCHNLEHEDGGMMGQFTVEA